MRSTMKPYYFRGKQGGELRMLRVLIADDESKVCQLIEKLVDWDVLGDGGCRSCRERDRGVGKNKRILPGYRDHGYPGCRDMTVWT